MVHQGRDRAYSSQSGVPFPSLNKQAMQQKDNKLLVSKLTNILGNKIQYRPSPSTGKKTTLGDVMKHGMANHNGV